MMVAYMALFPNVEKLHFCNMDLRCFAPLTNLLGACRQLKGLSFHGVSLDAIDSDSEEFDSDSEADIDSGYEAPVGSEPPLSFHSPSLDADSDSELDIDSEYEASVGSDPLDIKGKRPERAQQTPFDLAALEELVVIDCYSEENDCLSRLIQCSKPSGLRTLSFGDFFHEGSYSIFGTQKLLHLSATSLVNLVIDSEFPYSGERLPNLPNIPA
jgi:hypothetical protein